MSVFNKSLVFIVGAGASKEVGLPVGNDLKILISNSLNILYADGYHQSAGDRVVGEAIRELSKLENDSRKDGNYFQNLCWLIRDALPLSISIDNFIDSHKDNKDIAVLSKLAIAKCILDAESTSLLMVGDNGDRDKLNYDRLDKTWYVKIFKVITQNCRFEELEERLNKIGIISFNYDRCIEHFLFHAIKTYYGANKDNVARVMRSLIIVHPYGKVGLLPWGFSGNTIGYGNQIQHENLLKISRSLVTFTEYVKTNEHGILSNLVQYAEKIAFIGFAYHSLNLKLLFQDYKPADYSGKKTVIGTAFGISTPDIRLVTSELCDTLNIHAGKVMIESDLMSSQLFDRYSRLLEIK